MAEQNLMKDDPEPPAPPKNGRGWWAATVTRNLGLLVVPALPLLGGVKDFLTPVADVKLNGAEREALNTSFELTAERATTVRRVVVEIDSPSLADRFVAGGPALLLGGLLLLLSYALWRIEVNTTAGPHQRPFTEKDERYLRRSASSLWVLWWAAVAAEVFGPGVMGLGREALAGNMSAGSLVILGAALMTGIFARVYHKGRHAYTDLEKIV